MSGLNAFRPESEQLPDDVDETLEDEIDEQTQRQGWKSGKQRKVVMMVADRALDMATYKPMGKRRLDAQRQVANELGYENYESVQDLCGRQLFKEEEYVPLNKWQRGFTQLLENIERGRLQECR